MVAQARWGGWLWACLPELGNHHRSGGGGAGRRDQDFLGSLSRVEWAGDPVRSRLARVGGSCTGGLDVPTHRLLE